MSFLVLSRKGVGEDETTLRVTEAGPGCIGASAGLGSSKHEGCAVVGGGEGQYRDCG